ncbi:MAG TPA: 50S ribosomal protein L11 methyltransferase [Rhizomicrobium sp.]|nr:50S ribosomal protein L11 methyltransferase [Rhizomicrobium sp.]
MMNAPPLWKATIHLRKSESADVVALLELTPPLPQAVLISEDPFKDDAYVEALYIDMPDGAFLEKVSGRQVHVALLPDADWIRLSQEGLPPVRAGRFFVYGAHDRGRVPDGVIPIRIEAGLAFGTGHHETTALCLSVLSALARKRRYRNVLDLGCGTGLLAIGAAMLWRQRVLASDIDVVAVEVTRENALSNGVGPWVRALTADGMSHPVLEAQGPYDLLMANILAGPLCRMAPDIARGVARGGTLVLSGLLRWQENQVLSFYRPHGLVFRDVRRQGQWSALVLERP